MTSRDRCSTGSVGDIAAGYDNFESDDELNVDFILMGSAAYNKEAQSLANKIIAIAERRKDALAFVSCFPWFTDC